MGEKVVDEKQLKRKANHQDTIQRTLWASSNEVDGLHEIHVDTPH
jgi:hypothetical protein